MQPAEYWIQHLSLKPHPEGGFFRETFRSVESILKADLPARFTGQRNFSTAIYFLLRSEDRSLFHRIKSDELWYWHAGSTLSIYMLDEAGLALHPLGDRPENGESFQLAVPANTWFGARMEQEESYALVSCTVAPGFDFEDFELADRNAMLEQYPVHREIIESLTSNAEIRRLEN